MIPLFFITLKIFVVMLAITLCIIIHRLIYIYIFRKKKLFYEYSIGIKYFFNFYIIFFLIIFLILTCNRIKIIKTFFFSKIFFSKKIML